MLYLISFLINTCFVGLLSINTGGDDSGSLSSQSHTLTVFTGWHSIFPPLSTFRYPAAQVLFSAFGKINTVPSGTSYSSIKYVSHLHKCLIFRLPLLVWRFWVHVNPPTLCPSELHLFNTSNL